MKWVVFKSFTSRSLWNSMVCRSFLAALWIARNANMEKMEQMQSCIVMFVWMLFCEFLSKTFKGCFYRSRIFFKEASENPKFHWEYGKHILKLLFRSNGFAISNCLQKFKNVAMESVLEYICSVRSPPFVNCFLLCHRIALLENQTAIFRHNHVFTTQSHIYSNNKQDTLRDSPDQTLNAVFLKIVDAQILFKIWKLTKNKKMLNWNRRNLRLGEYGESGGEPPHFITLLFGTL